MALHKNVKEDRLIEFRAWARHANKGGNFVYHAEGEPRSPALFEHAMKLSEAGLVFLYQERVPCLGWVKVAKRCSPAAIAVLDKVSARILAPASTEVLTLDDELVKAASNAVAKGVLGVAL